jgi:hypothetical protein
VQINMILFPFVDPLLHTCTAGLVVRDIDRHGSGRGLPFKHNNKSNNFLWLGPSKLSPE